MTQHSNEAVTARTQGAMGGSFARSSPWMALLSSFSALLAHIGLMLGATATLSLLNLIVDPAGEWARAIFVIWLVLLVAHAIGIVILRLLNDDAGASTPLPGIQAEPHNGPTTTWEHATTDASSQEAGPDDPWRDAAAPATEPDISWPQPASSSPEQEPPASDGASRPDNGREGWNDNEKVPWRAATEIAWLRNRRETGRDREPKRRDSAS